VKKLEQDRPLSDDINTVTRVVEDGKILEAAEKTMRRLNRTRKQRSGLCD